ncbi:MAG: flagellar motor switch protein FliN [Ignavibacteria bacterium]|nr:flagellar motor switch protein FliN [Ignavibacteria bacterium]
MEEELKQGEESLKVGERSDKDNRNGNANTKAAVISEAELPEFEESRFSGNDSMERLSFLKDLQLSIYIELGRTQMQIKEILELERGYVIELDKLASEPVDIFVNNKKIAEGEVVVIDKHFGIRIVNLVDISSRLKGL